MFEMHLLIVILWLCRGVADEYKAAELLNMSQNRGRIYNYQTQSIIL